MIEDFNIFFNSGYTAKKGDIILLNKKALFVGEIPFLYAFVLKLFGFIIIFYNIHPKRFCKGLIEKIIVDYVYL